jgi:hypothetical protein
MTATTKIEVEITGTIALRRLLDSEGIDHDVLVVKVSDAAGKVKRN